MGGKSYFYDVSWMIQSFFNFSTELKSHPCGHYNVGTANITEYHEPVTLMAMANNQPHPTKIKHA